MNYTELESKVREATNNEPWGCPTTLMQEIANATYNYQGLNEIMPLIYKRFTEKSAEEWRQIYKALQLLEFLIKNGAERVIDDVRSHMSLLKMLRQFHYTDQNGKDQGLNVRNRSKELVDLLSDVDRIRTERKKSKATRNKYGGVEGGAGLGGSGMTTSTSTSRYGGFGSETAVGGGYGGFSGGVYGDGGGFGGAPDDQDNEYATTQARRDQFQEYDEYDEGDDAAPSRKSNAPPAVSTSSKPKATAPKPAAAPPPKAKQPEVDLFDFSADDIPISTTLAPAPNGKQPAALAADDEFDDFQAAGAAGDDEFDDFQAAPAPSAATTSTVTSATQFASPAPLATQAQSQQFNNLYSITSPTSNTSSPAPNYSAFSMPAPTQPQAQRFQPPMTATAPKPAGFQPSGPNYFTSIQAQPSPASPAAGTASGMKSPLGGAAKPKAAGGSDPFASLAGFGAAGAKKTGAGAANKGPTMADMARQQASASIWGAPAAPTNGQGNGQSGGSGNDLLF